MRLSGLVKVFAAMWVAVLGLVGNVWAQDTYTVRFNPDNVGGTGATPSSANVKDGDTLGEEQMPLTGEFTKTGYTHDGKWYIRIGTGKDNYEYIVFSFGENGTPVTGDMVTDNSITLYLKWTPSPYIITYNVDGETNENPVSYTIESSTITLKSPTKTGYTFAGWFDSETDGNRILTINTGSTGNKTFWARWTINIYTVNFDLNGGAKAVFSEDFEGTNSFTVVNRNENASSTRSITVSMQDSYGDGWEGASLRISVNGTTRANATISSGYSSNSYTFSANTGDAVVFYWVSGRSDSECSFTVYYADDYSTLLSRSGLSGASGTLGSFTVAVSNQNRWYVGTDTKYDGTKAAYIATHNGTSNSYTITSASTVHMYRNVTFPVSTYSYSLSFNWKGMGEANYDYLSVHLVDTSVTPIAGTVVSSGTVLGTYRGYDSWQQASVSIPASNSGSTKRLVFTWRNNASGGTAPPIAIDNIILESQSSIANVSVSHGSTLSEEQMPSADEFTKTGYTYDSKWYERTGTEEEGYEYSEFNFGENGTPVTGNMTLYLKWIPVYNISFNLNGGSGAVPTDITVETGSTLSTLQIPPTREFTRSGYVNDGKWYTRTGTVYTEFIFGDDGTPVTADITLYLRWIQAHTYTINFNLEGGSGTVPSPVYVATDNTIFKEDFENTNSFTLVNGSTNQWYVGTDTQYGDGGSKSAYIAESGGTVNSYDFTSASMVHLYRDVTFPASAEPCTLSFYWKGIGEINPDPFDYLSVHLVETLTLISSDVAVPSGLLGIYGGNDSWQLATIIVPVLNNGTTKRLVFTWRNDDAKGGQPPIAVDNIVLKKAGYGSGTATTTEPSTSVFTRTGYAHDSKWYTRTGTSDTNYVYTEFLFGETPVTNNVTLYLKWTPLYTITFNANGGIVSPSSDTTGIDRKLASLPTPTRNGYTFDGWYTTATDSTKIDTSTVFNANTTIYAQWKCSYLDANGETQYISGVTEMNSSISKTLSGWYLVRGNLALSTLTVSDTAHIILADSSSLTVTGNSSNAGISVSEGNILTIYAQSTGNNMGSLTATGGSSGGAGIGGGSGYSGGTVTINGGVVTATEGSGAQGIGRGSNGGNAGTFAMNGNAIVFASSVGDNNESRRTGGILFIGNNGTFYGTNITLSNITIPANHTLSIPSGSTLTVPSGVTLTNNGTIIPANGSTIAINGTLIGKINGANTASPTVIMKTATSVILGDDIKLLAATGQGIEYAISESDSALAVPAGSWQTNPVFTKLKPETVYYVFARSGANDNFNAGTASTALQVETMPATITVIAAPHCVGTACYTTPASYYTLRGTPLGAQKPTTPGVYIEKQGYVSRKIVVR